MLVEAGDFISKGFELIPGLFSKTSGLINLVSKNNVVRIISIKSGLVYEAKRFKNLSKKLYFPGESIFDKLIIKNLAFCDQIIERNTNKILVRPVEIYELPYKSVTSFDSLITNKNSQNFKLKSFYFYKPNQIIKGKKNLDLISNILTFKTKKFLPTNQNITLVNNSKKSSINFIFHESLPLQNYLLSNLKYKDICSSFLVQKNQFISNYVVLGYMEALTLNYLEIIKFKIKKQISKEIFLISNKDCLTVSKSEISNKGLNDFISIL